MSNDYQVCPRCGMIHPERTLKKCPQCLRLFYTDWHDKEKLCHKCRRKLKERDERK